MDFLVLAYESDGDPLWSQTIDGYGYFDAAGHIYRRSSTLLAVDGVVQQDLNTWKLGQQYITMSTGVLSGGLTTAGSVDLDEIRDIVNDSDNNIYVTGYVDNGAIKRDIVTVKLNEDFSLAWSRTYNGSSNLDDEPHALMVDEATGNVYVAGFTTKTGEGKNIAVLKYNSSGTLQWGNSRNGQVDVDDEAFDIAIDTSGQIILGGYLTEEGNKDYFVEILNSSGASQWIERFNGVHNLDDRGKKLVVETSSRISLTGKTATPDGDTYTTVRYTPKSILIPPDEEEASSALYFTENRGQLLDTEGDAVPEIKFYSDPQSPALFFQEEGFSLVTAIMDGDTATNDTLHRVDVRFRQSKGAERIYALEPRTDFHNYYLGHIPEGREKVGLYERLIHTDAFTGIDLQLQQQRGPQVLLRGVFGGDDSDRINEIVINKSTGHFYLTGRTQSEGYSSTMPNCSPPTDGGFPSCIPEGGGSHFPFVGGEINSDIFIAEFNPENELVWTTFLGGEAEDMISDHTQSSIAINYLQNPNEIAIIGTTHDFQSDEFPENPGGEYFQGTTGAKQFIAVFESRELSWLFAIGCMEGSGVINGYTGEGVAYSPDGELFAVGFTECEPQDDNDWCTAPADNTFPICPPSSSAFFFQDFTIGNPQPANHGQEDAYISGFSTERALFYSTFLGGDQFEYPVATAFGNTARTLYIVGNTGSNSTSMQLGSVGGYLQTQGGRNGFIARLDMPLSVNAEEVISKQEEHFKLFPNPSTDQLKIELPRPALPGMRILFYDVLGQLIGSRAFPPYSLTTEMDVSHLPAGVYTIVVGNRAQLFIKQ